MGIQAIDICKAYGDRTILHNVCFDLPSQANLAIWGPNGCGKTTLLRILTTLERPSSGTALVGSFDIKKEASQVRAHIGVVAHEPMLYPNLTALENLVFFAKLYGVSNPQKKALELLDQVGLKSRQLDLAKIFSKGMTQRLAVARALISDPDLLFLDEPYNGLDEAATRTLNSILADACAQRTVVLVSHDAQLVTQFATHVLILSKKEHTPRFIDVQHTSETEKLALLHEAVQ